MNSKTVQYKLFIPIRREKEKKREHQKFVGWYKTLLHITGILEEKESIGLNKPSQCSKNRSSGTVKQTG